MIHIDYSDGTSAWLTDEQLKEKHPELHKHLHRPAPHSEYGAKLKAIRINKSVLMRDMAKRLGCCASEVSDIERGIIPATQEQVEAYQRLKQEA